MTRSAARAPDVAVPELRGADAAERLRLALLWLTGFSGGFVFIEPSPYEVVVAAAIGVFALGGMKLRAAHVPLLLILVFYVIADGIGVVPVIAADKTVMWALVSCFMAITSMFFALALADNTERRLHILVAGYIAGALTVSVIAILAYFHLVPSADTFLYLGRAKATFKDPNVFGPFLVLPILVVVGRVLSGHARSIVVSALMLLVMLTAELLSFSRGAWGHLGGSMVLVIVFNLLTSRSAKERFRIVAFVGAGVALGTALLVVILSIGQVSALLQERASLEQSYDVGPLGRFGRHALGFLLMLERPIGIGPLQFTKIFPEDPHNSFLDAFMTGGWLGGFCYITLVAVTLAFGLRYVFVRAPWQRAYIAFYATFVAVVAESYIIDVQHWRHFFLIIGVIWGLMAAAHASRAVAPLTRRDYSPRPLGA